jgi:hypothetical protein
MHIWLEDRWSRSASRGAPAFGDDARLRLRKSRFADLGYTLGRGVTKPSEFAVMMMKSRKARTRAEGKRRDE